MYVNPKIVKMCLSGSVCFKCRDISCNIQFMTRVQAPKCGRKEWNSTRGGRGEGTQESDLVKKKKCCEFVILALFLAIQFNTPCFFCLVVLFSKIFSLKVHFVILKCYFYAIVHLSSVDIHNKWTSPLNKFSVNPDVVSYARLSVSHCCIYYYVGISNVWLVQMWQLFRQKYICRKMFHTWTWYT